MRRSLARLLALILSLACGNAQAYGVTGHLRVVVEDWDLLFLKPVPLSMTHGQTLFAAMLGAIVSDVGYAYKDLEGFSDRVHYLRAWEFSDRLIALARSPGYRNEQVALAIALGTRAHYWADRVGHPNGTNEIVAKLRVNDGVAGTPAPRHVDYETDKVRHVRVETRAATFDLRQAPDAVLTGYLRYLRELRESGKVLEMTARMITEVMRELFPGSKLALDARLLLSYALFAAETICEGTRVVQQDARETLARLRKQCNSDADYYHKQELKPDTLSATELWHDLEKSLGPDERMIFGAIYDKSHVLVREQIRNAEQTSADPHVNLDTGLPRAGHTYVLADRALDIAVQATKANGTPTEQNMVEAFRKSYYEAGNSARAFFTQKIGSQANGEAILQGSAGSVDVDAWLAQIAPGTAGVTRPRLRVAHSCEAAGIPVHLPSPASNVVAFALDRQGTTLCARSDSRSIELLYAMGVARAAVRDGGRGVDAKSVATAVNLEGASYVEALQRLKLRH